MKTGTDKRLIYAGFKVQGDFGPITCYTNKRNRVVWFLKAPPRSPPTADQLALREQFRTIALDWKALTDGQRQIWLSTSALAHLRISGYNLFVYWKMTDDDSTIKTIAHQSGLTLPPP